LTVTTHIDDPLLADAVDLSWKPIDTAVGYEISVDGSSATIKLSDAFMRFGTVTSGPHTYKVRAYDKDGKFSGWSNTVSAIVSLTEPEVTATGGQNTITATWKPVPGATGYEVLLDRVTTPAIKVTGTTYTFTGLKAKEFYTFGVTATAPGIRSFGAGGATTQ